MKFIFTITATLLGLASGIKLQDNRATNPDLGQGKWWIKHDHWRAVPSIANGMPLLTDGCRIRLHNKDNFRTDGNGRLEWEGNQIVFYMDAHPQNKRVFKLQADGTYQENQHPNAWVISWKGDGAPVQRSENEKCASSASGTGAQWFKQSVLYHHKNLPITQTAKHPDFSVGTWWIKFDVLKKYVNWANGMPIMFDGCRFRLYNTGNKRDDGNGVINWTSAGHFTWNTDKRQKDNQPAIPLKQVSEGVYKYGVYPNAVTMTYHGEGSPVFNDGQCPSKRGSWTPIAPAVAQPTPDPEPAPTPQPAPAPKPTPQPAPAPKPTPKPAPAPTPEPNPDDNKGESTNGGDKSSTDGNGNPICVNGTTPAGMACKIFLKSDTNKDNYLTRPEMTKGIDANYASKMSKQAQSIAVEKKTVKHELLEDFKKYSKVDQKDVEQMIRDHLEKSTVTS